MITGQFIRYFIGGCISLAVHLLVMAILIEGFNTNATAASGMGFMVALVTNYSLQRAWVFRAAGKHTVFFFRYLAVTVITFSINIGLFWLAYHILGLWYWLAQILVTGIVFLANYTINRHYTFRSPS